MNHKSIKTLTLGILAAICLGTQCDKPDDNSKPTATNTFSALVNGEPFVRASGNLKYPRPTLTAHYNHETKRLHIQCLAAGDKFHSIDLIVYNPREGESNTLSLGYLMVETRSCWGFGCEDCGRIFIKRFDTINRIVSGTFEFSGRCAAHHIYRDTSGNLQYVGDSVVHVTQGRFDVRLTIID